MHCHTLLFLSLSFSLFLFMYFIWFCMHNNPLHDDGSRANRREDLRVYKSCFHTSTSRSGNSRIFLLFFVQLFYFILFFFFYSSRDYLVVEVVQTNTISTSDGSSSDLTLSSTFGRCLACGKTIIVWQFRLRGLSLLLLERGKEFGVCCTIFDGKF